MAIEQTIGGLGEKFHESTAAFERSLEQPRILLDRLAKRLDWVKHVPSTALRTTLVLAGLYVIATGSNYVAAGNFNPAEQDQENLKNHPALIANSNVTLGNFSPEIAAVGPNPPDSDKLNTVSSVSVSGVETVNLSPALSEAITKEFGQTQGTISWDGLIKKLTASDVVGCIGESHRKDQTQEITIEKDILQALRDQLPNKPIALATERFTDTMQPQLEAMLKLPIGERLAFLESVIFESPDYKDTWGRNNPFYSENNKQFEDMVKWAVQQGFALIGLDNSRSDYTDTGGLTVTSKAFSLSYRNPLWAKHTLGFLEAHKDEKYLVVAVGGYAHINNKDPISYCPSLLQQAGLKTITVGLSFEDDGLSSTPLTAGLARDLGFGRFVVVQPEHVGFWLDKNQTPRSLDVMTDFWIVN